MGELVLNSVWLQEREVNIEESTMYFQGTGLVRHIVAPGSLATFTLIIQNVDALSAVALAQVQSSSGLPFSILGNRESRVRRKWRGPYERRWTVP